MAATAWQADTLPLRKPSQAVSDGHPRFYKERRDPGAYSSNSDCRAARTQ